MTSATIKVLLSHLLRILFVSSDDRKPILLNVQLLPFIYVYYIILLIACQYLSL